VLADDRIAMGASARIEVALPAPRAGTLVVEVVWREASAELAAAVGAPAPREEPLIVARVPFEGPGANGRRARLPRAITLGDLALAGRRR